MIWALLVLAAPPRPDALLDRFAAFLRSAKTLSVQIEATSSGLPGRGTGKLAWSRPSRLSFDMVWGQQSYGLRGAQAGSLEFERSARIYSEGEGLDGLVPPDARVSPIPGNGLPSMLVLGSLRPLLPQGSKLSLVGQEKVGGAVAQHVAANGSTPGGTAKVDMWFGARGELLRFILDVRSPMGSHRAEVRLSRYVVNAKLPANLFSRTVPAGFVPFAFTPESWPLQPGAAFPPQGWADGRSHAASILPGPAKPALVAVLSEGSGPSRRCLPWLKTLSASIAVVLVAAERTAPSRLLATGLPVRVDPSGRLIGKVAGPGTPLFYLLDGKGQVERVWYGYQAATAEPLKAEILAAWKELGKAR